MKKTGIFMFLITISFSTSIAQSVGFMGKRLIIRSGFHITYDNRSGEGQISHIFPPRIMPILGIEYVTSRKESIVIEGQVSSLNIANNFDKFLPVKNENQKNYLRMNSYTLAVNLKKFKLKSDFISPVGKYISTDFFFTRMFINDVNAIYLPKNAILYKTTGVGFGFTFGRQGIINKKILWDLGLNFNVPIPISGKLSKNEKDAIYSAQNTYIRNMLIRFKLGIGILAK
jgi:hypothetical protein